MLYLYSIYSNLWVVTQILQVDHAALCYKVKTTPSQTLLLKASVFACLLSQWCLCLCARPGQFCVDLEEAHFSDYFETHSDSRTYPPGPMPTLMMSAPERMSSSTISPVTTLPACKADIISPKTQSSSQSGEPSLLPWWCAWETFLWPSWQTPQSTQSSRWPRPDRCTWGRGWLPRWHTASPDLRCRCLSWQLHAGERNHNYLFRRRPL